MPDDKMMTPSTHGVSAAAAGKSREVESQAVSLNGRLVTLSGVALEVMRAMEKAEHAATKAAFERGYSGGLGFARGVCDEHNATLDHVRIRVDANLASRLQPTAAVERPTSREDDQVDAWHELLVVLGLDDTINVSPAEAMWYARNEIIQLRSRLQPAAAPHGASPALRAQEEFGDGLPYLPDGAMDPLYVLLERLDQQDDKLSADAARNIRKMRHAAEAGHAMYHYVQALELKIATAKELIGAKNDSLGSAVKEANINSAWHRLNEAEGIIWNAHRYWSQPHYETANQPRGLSAADAPCAEGVMQEFDKELG